MSVTEKIRLNIIQSLYNISDVQVLQELNETIANLSVAQPAASNDPPFLKATTDLNDLSLEEIMVSQGYTPLSYEEFREKVRDTDWGVSLEAMLNCIN